MKKPEPGIDTIIIIIIIMILLDVLKSHTGFLPFDLSHQLGGKKKTKTFLFV